MCYHNRACSSCCCSRQSFYIAGLVMISAGLFTILWGLFSPTWVYREGGTSLTSESVERFGLWRACAPKSFEVCRNIFDALPQVGGAARGSQALITISVLFITLCFVGEILSCIPCDLTKKKCKAIFDNRVIEYIIAIACVVGFLGMLVFAAEVKNKASRDIGQEDQTGRGFGFSLSGQMITVFGCCLLACGRRVEDGTTTV